MAGDAPGTAHENPASPGVPPVPARLALYRRYRPATFAEVKGQEHVTEPLRQALRNGRVHHAYLFSGPRGCGKTSSARILARSLNCVLGPTPDPCGTCDSCIALGPAGPGSIDVIEIDAASHGGVDDARDLRERAFYAPVAGRFKVYIIDEAHMVTREGFNALLKLVEEPPPHLKFVFATTEPEKVIPTIRSRTHHYPFRLVPPAVLRELLEEILAAEGVTYQPSVLPLVVRAGAGSVRDSLSVLDQLLAGAGDEGLTYDRTVALLGYSDDSLLDDMVEALASGDGAAVFGTVDRVVQGGHDPRRFAADLLDRTRDLIILAAVPGAGKTGLLDAPADRLERMAGQAGSFGQAELARAAEILSEGLIQMRGTTSPRLLLELMCAQILLPGASTGERVLLARLDRLERRLEGAAPSPGPAGGGAASVSGHAPPQEPGEGPAPTSGTRDRTPAAGETPDHATPPRQPRARADQTREATPGEPAEPGTTRARPASAAGGGPADAETLRERWPEILTAVRGERRVAWLLLQTASVQSLEQGVLTLAFPREGEARGFSASGHDQVLIGVLATMLGLNVRVRPAVGTGAGSGRQATTRQGGQPGPGGGPTGGPGSPIPEGSSAGSPAPGGSAPAPGGSAPAPGGYAPAPGGSAPAPGGYAPAPGGSAPGTGGSALALGGSAPGTGGSAPTPGGSAPGTGGSALGTGGSAPAPGGSAPAPEGSAPGAASTGTSREAPAAGQAATAGKTGDAERPAPEGRGGKPARPASGRSPRGRPPSGRPQGGNPSGGRPPGGRPAAAPPPADSPPGRAGSGQSRPPGQAAAYDGEEWPDDAGEGSGAGNADALTGMELIQRQLGGRIIEEIEES